MQESGKECQGPPGVESGDGHEGQRETLLPVDQQQKKNQRNHGPCAEWDWRLATKSLEKTEVLSVFFATVFTGKTCLQESQVIETSQEVWSKKDCTLGEGGFIQGTLKQTGHTQVHKT